jgi:hypothetical protein
MTQDVKDLLGPIVSMTSKKMMVRRRHPLCVPRSPHHYSLSQYVDLQDFQETRSKALQRGVSVDVVPCITDGSHQ